MKGWKMVSACFVLAAVLFIAVAAVRVARGGDNSASFFALGGTFCGLAAAFIALKGGRAKNPADPGAPPPA